MARLNKNILLALLFAMASHQAFAEDAPAATPDAPEAPAQAEIPANPAPAMKSLQDIPDNGAAAQAAPSSPAIPDSAVNNQPAAPALPAPSAPVAQPAPVATPPSTPAQHIIPAQPGQPAANNLPSSISNNPLVDANRLKSVATSQPPLLPEVTRKAPAAPPLFIRSFMFKSDDVDKLRLIYDSYLQKIRESTSDTPSVNGHSEEVEQILNNLNKRPNKPNQQQGPQTIYLNSLLFSDTNNASAWINGTKYSLNTEVNNITLVKVTPSAVEIKLNISHLANNNFTEWQNKFPGLHDSDADQRASQLPADERGIRVDKESQSIYFVLHANQYLDLNRKNIREGKPAAAPAPAAPKPNVPAPAIPNKGSVPMPAKPGQTIKPTPTAATASFKKNIDGHFYIPAQITGANIVFKVDTGATVTAIGGDDAKRIGINIDKLNYRFDLKIADGTLIKAAETKVNNFSIGNNIKLDDVSILVTKGKISQPLLGMSFLNKLKKFSIEGDTLTISQ